MQVILMKSVPNLGSTGDLVNVKNSYARNFLIPNGFAKLAQAPTLRSLSTISVLLPTVRLRALGEAESLARFSLVSSLR